MPRQKVNPATGTDPGIQLTEEQQAGIKLAYFLLTVISAIILIYSIFFFFKDFDGSDKVYEVLSPINVNDSTFAKRIEQVHQMTQEKRDYREFVTKNFQYLIGVLLPILTSILGYIFGTRTKK